MCTVSLAQQISENYKKKMYSIKLQQLKNLFQVQYFLKILSGEKQLPSTEDMITDTQDYIEKKKADGFTLRNYHTLGQERIKEYYDMIASLAGIPPVQPVIAKIFKENFKARQANIRTYRSINYHIIDDDSFYTSCLEE